MKITDLPLSSSFSNSDVLAIEVNGVTYKLTGATLATALESIGSYVTGVKGNSETNYRTGDVNITPANIGLGNVDNTSDANKPVSTATQTALDALKTAILANFAGAFVQATAYPAGTYVTYTDGFMYVLPDGHEADVTWANTTKTKVTTGKELSDLKGAVQLDEKYALLLHDEIPGTTQTIAFDSSGNVSTITHTNCSNVAVRTDAFTFSANSIADVRTLNTGESLTIVTNIDTLVTTVTYAAAA